MRFKLVLVIVLAICSDSVAQVASWINLENQLVLEPLGDRVVDLGALDLQSQAGLLIPGTAWEPFQFHLSNTEHQVTYGQLGFSAPRIEGSTTLDVRYDLQSALEAGLNPCDDIALGIFSRRSTQLCTIPGDADFSGTVDFSDFLILSENFGLSETVWRTGDFDWDRQTGFSDFLQLSENFGADISELLIQPGEPAIVRTSTSEEIEYLAGTFSAPQSLDADYLVDDGLLWVLTSIADPDAASLFEDTPITIVAPAISNRRATSFGFEMTREGQDFELVSVRLKSSVQTLEFVPPRSLVLPIGTLDSGQYEVGITQYEFTDDGGVGLDVDEFLADPTNFELPDGPILSSITTSTLSFEVAASGAVSVPEPQFELFSMVLLTGLVVRLSQRHRKSQRRR